VTFIIVITQYGVTIATNCPVLSSCMNVNYVVRRYWKLEEEAQDRTLWRTQFGRGYWPVARQTNTWLEVTNDREIFWRVLSPGI
jgi:hypothetical protein